mgnify:CR=1 FL=1
MITVTDLATVCQTVRSERSLLSSVKAAAYDEAAVQEIKRKNAGNGTDTGWRMPGFKNASA